MEIWTYIMRKYETENLMMWNQLVWLTLRSIRRH